MVLAFQPRSIDPPHFVAETYEDLDAKVGEMIGGEQCDNCGNSTYVVETVGHGSPRPIRGHSAICTTDPDRDLEYPKEERFEGCGRGYPISWWAEKDVVF